MEEVSMQGMAHVPEEALSIMNKGQVPAEVHPEVRGEPRTSCGAPLEDGQGMDTYPFMNVGCTRKANFRDSFYPQYVNMKPEAYLARYTGNETYGYDRSARYAGTGGGRHSYDGDRGDYDGGMRGSYM